MCFNSLAEVAFKKVKPKPENVDTGVCLLYDAATGPTMRYHLSLLALFLFALSCATAQTITASLDGTVTDSSGGVIPGAKITVVNINTNSRFETETGPAGRFLAPALPPGPYTVIAESSGFRRVQRTGLVLQVNQAARIEIVLEVGEVSETVEVTGEAPLLEATTSAIAQVIGNTSVVNLPLNQRNPYALVLLVPGVNGSVGFGFNNVNFSVNGGRPGTNEILLDGIPSSPTLVNPAQGYSVFPSVDAVQEFRVQTNNYSAEFGRSGGAVVNLIYKSGTNNFRGSLFEFLRNSKLDANDYFANSRGIPLASFKRNQFGASIGGPVSIPKVYDGKNKTFFFFAYEGLRQRSAANLLNSVPTELQRAGDFTQTLNSAGALINIYDPATTTRVGNAFVRQVFPGNVIPGSRIDPVARNVVRYFPMPNGPGDRFTGRNNFAAQGTSPTDINQWDLRGDQIINDNHRFFVRYSRRKLDIGLPDFFPAEILIAQTGTFEPQNSMGAAFDYTWNVSPTFLTNFRLGFGRMLLAFRPRSDGFDPTDLGFPTYIRENADRMMFPGFALTDYRGLGDGGAQFRRNAFETYSMHWANTKITANHTLKFGYEQRLLRVNNTEAGLASGQFNFNRAFTQGPNPNAASAIAGDTMGSFLLGLAASGTLTKQFKAVGTVSNYYAWYIADDWKVSRKLTLNLGLRYELDVPRVERYNRMNYFDPLAPSPLAGPSGLANLTGGLVFVGVDGNSRRQFPTDANNWAPRFGFAYQTSSSTVIRGAYGIFYAPSQTAAGGTVGNFGFRSDTPHVSSLDGVTPLNFLRDPFPDGFVAAPGAALGLLSQVGTGIQAPLRDTIVPYSQNWNLNIQRQLPGNTLVEVGYVGRRGLKLNESQEGDYNLNQLRPEFLSLGTGLQQQVPNPFRGLIDSGPIAGVNVPAGFLLRAHPQFTTVGPLFKTGASSIYHSVQIKAEKRFSQGLTLLLSYTGAKLIDDYSRTAVVGRTSGMQNIYDRRAERAVSLQDVAQRMVISYVYDLPFGRSRRFGSDWNRLVDGILGGWQVNGITTYESGLPLSITTQNTANAGNAVLRPNNNGSSAALDGRIGDRLNRYFDTSVFAQPAAFTFGNTGRTLPDVRGPGVRNWDFSLFKNFRVDEQRSFQFRAELFNSFNRVQFGFPNQNLNNIQFGLINSQANTPRQVQLALKFLF